MKIDISRYTIRIKGKDKTNEIESLEEFSNKYLIKFKQNKKVYEYKKQHIGIYPKHIEKTDKEISRKSSILKYFGDALELILSGEPEGEDQSRRDILEGVKSEIEKILKCEKVSEPLSIFLEGSNVVEEHGFDEYIFPFDCNKTQIESVKQVFKNKLSVIEGPPGTGKTQTILNIISNAIYHGETVAVVSNNNNAVKNVFEKLEEREQLNFLAALLGNAEKVKEFKSWEHNTPTWIQDFNFENEVFDEESKAFDLFELSNNIKKKEDELKRWENEFEKFKECYAGFVDPVQITLEDFQLIKKYIKICNKYIFRGENRFPLWRRILEYFRLRTVDYKFLKLDILKIITSLKNLFYLKKIESIKGEIESLNKDLREKNFIKIRNSLSEKSLNRLKKKLCDRYRPLLKNNNGVIPFRAFGHNFINVQELLRVFPIVLATTYTIRKFAPEDGFDVLIIDESSQVDIFTGAIALSAAKRVVIVGDEKQLPCVVEKQDFRRIGSLNEETIAQFPYFKGYIYKPGQSILSSVKENVPNIKNQILLEHYRCAPLIIGFCNQKYYGNKLIVYSKETQEQSLHLKFVLPDCFNRVNYSEAEEIKRLKNEIESKLKYSDLDIGITTPYRNMAKEVGGATVHSFQGREQKVIILSTVDPQLTDFSADDKLINVAVSRAQEHLYLLTSSVNLKKNNSVSDLINYIQYYSKDVSHGKKSSVFELLYDEIYSESYNVRNVKTDSPAEEIVLNILNEVLESLDKDSRYAVELHIPLCEIIYQKRAINFGSMKKFEELSSEERIFSANILSHVDFLIYEKFGKTPLCAIEVDGKKHLSERQKRRDRMKDEILKNQKIPLKRISTSLRKSSRSNLLSEIKKFLSESLKVELR